MVNIPKFKVPVYILMSDGAGIYCVIFARQNQRLIEILGDIRAFIPVETNVGVQLINKAHILRVVVLTKEQMMEQAALFPDVNTYYLENNSW